MRIVDITDDELREQVEKARKEVRMTYIRLIISELESIDAFKGKRIWGYATLLYNEYSLRKEFPDFLIESIQKSKPYLIGKMKPADCYAYILKIIKNEEKSRAEEGDIV